MRARTAVVRYPLRHTDCLRGVFMTCSLFSVTVRLLGGKQHAAGAYLGSIPALRIVLTVTCRCLSTRLQPPVRLNTTWRRTRVGAGRRLGIHGRDVKQNLAPGA